MDFKLNFCLISFFQYSWRVERGSVSLSLHDMVKRRKIKSLSMPYYWKQSNVRTPDARPSPQDLRTQSSPEQHEVTSLLFVSPSHSCLSFKILSTHLALLTQVKIIFFTFILGEWHNLYTSLQKNSHAQHFLQTRHLIYIWTAFSVSNYFLREGYKHLKYQSSDSFL